MKRVILIWTLLALSVGLCHAQSDDIELTDSTSTDWGGGGGSITPQEPDDPVTELNLSKATLTLEGGQRERLVATVNARAKNKEIIWTSANSSVASVDKNGTVTGLSIGTTTITATAAGNTSLSKECTVTVTSDFTERILPNVPFEFYYDAASYDAGSHTLANHSQARLADYALQLTEGLPTMVDDELLRLTSRCEGYIDRWDKGSTESGAYFYREGQDCMTIVTKVAPRLFSSNYGCDFISNRGGDYNYMFRIGQGEGFLLHTRDAYSVDRTLKLTPEEPQVLAVRVDGINDFILLENLTTHERLRVDGVHWGGDNNVFKIFYNDGGEYFLGDFYWVYYSFELLTDAELSLFDETPAEEEGDFTLKLSEGWNWFSHPQQQAVSPTDVVGSDGERMISQTQEIVNDTQYGWVGNLQELQPGQGYKALMKADHTAVLPEAPLHTQDVTLYTGWNWVGYNHTFSAPTPHALAPTAAEDGDIIFGKDFFAIYFNRQWLGMLDSIHPGQGYMYKSASEKTLRYNSNRPMTESARATTLPSPAKVAPPATWTVDNSRYSSQMAIIGSLYNGAQEQEPQVVGAFCGDECRGISNNIAGRVFLSIGGEPGQAIKLRTLNDDGSIEDIEETLTFDSDIHGSMAEPMKLHLSGQTTSGVKTAKAESPASGQTAYDLGGRPGSAHGRSLHILRGKKVVR